MVNRRKTGGQTVLEYATMVIVILSALVLLQKYILRGFAGRLKSVGDSLGQERIYDPINTKECRFASFFQGAGVTGQWFDQKCFESSCKFSCLGPNRNLGACNGCLVGCNMGCDPGSP